MVKGKRGEPELKCTHVQLCGHCPHEVTTALLLCPSVSLTMVNSASRPLTRLLLSSYNAEAHEGFLLASAVFRQNLTLSCFH